MTVLAKEAYLRPGEVHAIRVEDLAPPAGGPQQGVQLWTLTVAPQSRGEVSKIGTMDDTVILDTLA